MLLTLGCPDLFDYAANNLGALYLVRTESPLNLVEAKQWLAVSNVQGGILRRNWLLGIVLWHEGNIKKAIATWRDGGFTTEAIEMAILQIAHQPNLRQQWEQQLVALPLSSKHLERIGDIYRNLEQYKKAVEFYELALSKVEDGIISKSDIYYKLGSIHQFYFADISSALGAYNSALYYGDFQSRWNYVDTYIQVASLLLGADNRRSLQAARSAVAIMPENVMAHTVLGLAIYAEEGKLAEAEQEMAIAAKLDPTSVWPWMHLGQLYFQAEMYNLSIDAYTNALIIAPDFAMAKDMIAFIRTNYLK